MCGDAAISVVRSAPNARRAVHCVWLGGAAALVRARIVGENVRLGHAAHREQQRDDDARAVLAVRAVDEDGRRRVVAAAAAAIAVAAAAAVAPSELLGAELERLLQELGALAHDEPVDVGEPHLVEQRAEADVDGRA